MISEARQELEEGLQDGLAFFETRPLGRALQDQDKALTAL
jgi:hypothetical protein